TIQFKQATGAKNNQRIDVVVVEQFGADAIVAEQAEKATRLISNGQIAVGQNGARYASCMVQGCDTRRDELIIGVEGKRMFKPGLAEQNVAGAGQAQVLCARQQPDAGIASRQFVGLLFRLIPGSVVENQDFSRAAQKIQGSQGALNRVGQETSL